MDSRGSPWGASGVRAARRGVGRGSGVLGDRDGLASSFNADRILFHEPSVGLAATLGVPDAFCINLCALGGIRRTLQMVAACAELGIDVWFYSPDAGVMNAAYLQVAAATPWISQPSQTLLRWHTDDVIVGGPMRPENGLLPVPDGPGLGVKLDREAVRRCHQRFLDDGAYDHYGDPSRSGYVTWG